MTEKDKLLHNLIEKSEKSKEEIEKLVHDKLDELSGLVSEEGAIYIIANELGVRLDVEKPKKDADLTKIEKITEAKVPVSLVCKVIRKYDRVNFSSEKGTEGSVQSLLVGDETGIIRIVFWNDKTELLETIHEGDVLKLINAYTRENANSERIEVHYTQYSNIEVNPEDTKVEVKEMNTEVEFTEKKIPDLVEGDRNVKLTGIVTDFDIPRFYLACPECFKKVFQDEGTHKCAIHEEITAIRVPIVNIVIDDGTSTITLVGFRDRAEALTNLKADDIVGLTENIDKYREFSKGLVGTKVEIGGNVSLNNMTGEKQVLVNQIINIEISEKPAQKEEPKKKEESKDDDLDIEIEEIDFDDDML